MFPTLRPYRSEWVRPDVVAGITAGTVVIPQALAYATIAGMPVEIGLYTCMLPMLVYAVLGGSRTLSVSTTSTIAILVTATLSALPARDADRLLRDAFTLTFLVGLCLLAMRLFRLGAIVENISSATLTGIKAGVGLTVAVTQLPQLLGVTPDAQDEGFFGQLADAVSKIPDANRATVAVSAVAIGVLLVLRRRWPRVPGPLVVVAGGIILVAVTSIESRGLALIDKVPSGLPSPTAPEFGDMGALLPGALAIAIMAFLESVLVARGNRGRAEPPVDSNQELLATGFAALAGGLSQSLPPAGGFSQSAVNQRAGARTQLAGIVTAVLAVLVALFLGPVLDDLPRAILAAMVIVATLGLLDFRAFVEYYRIDRSEFWVAVVTAAIGLTSGLLLAVAVGVILTLVLVLRQLDRPRVRPLYARPGGGWTPLPAPSDQPAAQQPAGIMVLHLDGALYTGNAQSTSTAIMAGVRAADPPPHAVVLEGSAVSKMTVTMLDALRTMQADLEVDHIALILAAFSPATLAAARQSAWFAALEQGGCVQPTVDDAVAFGMALDR